jgi:uncharacterized coiled-coil protein SlyX
MVSAGRRVVDVEFTLVAVPAGWAKQVSKDLAAIKRVLGIIHREQEHDMAELDDRLADLQAAEDTNTAKLARLITDFEAAGTLTPDQTAALDALKAEIVGNSDAIDAADPEVPPAV